MTDLDKLIEAVEAGDYGDMVGPLRRLASAAHAGGKLWPGHDIEHAFSGSLDAALRLHEALLPGWVWAPEIGNSGQCQGYMSPPTSANGITEDAANPARAWLLAILRAVKAQGERG